MEAVDETNAGSLPAMKKGRPEAALFYYVSLIGSQKVHSWLFAPRKAKSVIFTFLTNQ
jgi:hypothetical protein